MSIDAYIILFGIILILVDIFFISDLPTFVSILLFCFVFFRRLPFQLPVRIILTILFFFAVLILYITIWRKIKIILVDKWFAKDRYKAGVYGFQGKKGAVRVLEGERLAYIDGDLYPFYTDYPIAENDEFIVKDIIDGKIVIEEG